MLKKVDSAGLRQVMGNFATGIAVATARNEKIGSFGLTVNSLTSLSLDPPLVLFCVEKSAFLHPHFKRAKYFAFNILSAGQEKVSRHFADRHHNPAPKNMWGTPQKECPILRGTLGWVLCKPHALHEGGDHTIFVGEVIGLHKNAGAKEPLIYFHGRYRDLAEAKVTSGSRK
ncbi:MAG: flavin reductase family protein [Alphaproteobacteria bacterium]|nr:flavin reductase family protein [Alphaproteobacteria bacterium]